MASLSGFQAYADRVIQKRLHSSLFKRVPFLAILAGKGGTQGQLGRPGAWAILGGRPAANKARMELQDGGEALHVRFQVDRVGGGKYMGTRDTSPSTGTTSQDQQVRTAEFKWCRYSQPIKVWNNTLLLAGNSKSKIASAVEEATEMAMEEAFEKIATDLWSGNPTDQTADIWNAPLGVTQMCDTDNTYANVNRSTYATWAGRDVTTATSLKLNIIDDANLVQLVAEKGPGVDFCLTTTANFNTLKQEALARNPQMVVETMPELAQVGVRNEAIRYGNCYVTFDPFATASYLGAFTSDQLAFVVHPQANFKVDKFVDQSQVPGGDDAVTSKIEVMYMLYTPQPWQHIMYKSIS